MTSNSPPDVLWHYCSNEAFVSILSNKIIRLSMLDASNDALEGRWVLDIARKEIEARGELDRYGPQLIEMLDRGLGVTSYCGFCFSEVGDLLSQWRGYAENGSGVAIGFAKSYLIGLGKECSGRGEGFGLHKITYGHNPSQHELKLLFDHVAELVSSGALPRPGLLSLVEDAESRKKRFGSLIMALGVLLMLRFNYKNPAFKEEREWRLVRLLISSDGTDRFRPMRYRAVGSKVVPFVEVELSHLDSCAMPRLILGPRNETKMTYIRWLLEDAGLGQTEVTRSTASYR